LKQLCDTPSNGLDEEHTGLSETRNERKGEDHDKTAGFLESGFGGGESLGLNAGGGVPDFGAGTANWSVGDGVDGSAA
jgi:hypothetical protein